MKVFFEPKSIAVVGAGRKRGTIGAEIFHNILATGFQGVVYPVNESAGVVGSVRAYPRITEIPDDIDLAIIVVPAERVDQGAPHPPPIAGGRHHPGHWHRQTSAQQLVQRSGFPADRLDRHCHITTQPDDFYHSLTTTAPSTRRPARILCQTH